MSFVSVQFQESFAVVCISDCPKVLLNTIRVTIERYWDTNQSITLNSFCVISTKYNF